MSAIQTRMTQDQRSALTKDKLATRRVRSDSRRRLCRFPHRGRRQGCRRVARRATAPLSDQGRSRVRRDPIRQRDGDTQKTAENLARFSPDDEPIEAIIEDSMDYYFSGAFDVAIDVVKAGSQNARTAARHRRFESRQFRDFAERGWLEKLVERGWSVSDAHDIIDLSTSLVRGFAIRKWIHRDSGQYKRLLERWVDIVYASFATPSQRRARGPITIDRRVTPREDHGFRNAERKRSAPPRRARVVRSKSESDGVAACASRLRRAALAAAMGSAGRTRTAADHRRRTQTRRHLAAEQSGRDQQLRHFARAARHEGATGPLSVAGAVRRRNVVSAVQRAEFRFRSCEPAHASRAGRRSLRDQRLEDLDVARAQGGHRRHGRAHESRPNANTKACRRSSSTCTRPASK